MFIEIWLNFKMQYRTTTRSDRKKLEMMKLG